MRIRLLPDSYLSWLSEFLLIEKTDEQLRLEFATTYPPRSIRTKFWWLAESLLAELRFRGLRADLAATDEPVIDIPERIETAPVRRRIVLE